ncbi:MAG: DUF4982 domain-containing protein [Muribaculaceae bacterium]|nr:DUF4982 domain-containing protein [Muribaculaceae bacterium]
MIRKALTLILSAASLLSAWALDPRDINFNADWQFALGDTVNASTSWRTLSLPHDWAIEGDFSADNPSGTGGGALPGGTGWYRKTFTMPKADKGKQVYIDFDGAYMNSTVWINGHRLGTRPYGYASFSYDLTPYLKWGGKNTLLVKVDNSEQPNSRWYSGCGIYRNVGLRVLSPVHVALWGTQVLTPDVSAEKATVELLTTIDNTTHRDASLRILSDVIAPGGKVVASASTDVTSAPGVNSPVSQTFTIKSPELWSTEHPAMYSVATRLERDGKIIDSYSTPLGIRYFNFDAERGFSLNGKEMKINGVCLHHDAGALGAVVNRRAIDRQLEIMKQMGVNAIRSSHNPPAPELLAACDSMGLLVMDETFDMWRRRKTSHDYSRYFDEWHERDLTDMMLRDRNHPSIIIWSIGNEVLEQWSDASADTLSLEEANMILNFGHSADMLAAEDEGLSLNSLLTIKLAEMTRALDPSRPVTAGCNEPSPGNHLFRSGALDIIGFNYHDDWFKDVPVNFPGKPFIVTESVSSLMTRGWYKGPSDSLILCPERWDKPYYDPSFACSAYGNCRAPWGNTHEGTLKLVKENPFISGQFIWTGFDYIGEPTPYGWPARSSYFGLVDLAGIPKDSYYLYQSEWRPDITVLHLLPHWNHDEGEVIDVLAYYNNADEVELFINGVSQGVSSKTPDRFHAKWTVPFTPGTLRAVSRRNGEVVAERVISTAGEPAQIRLTPDRRAIKADGTDLSYVLVEILDDRGNLCPLADNLVTFDVSGAGFNAGVDNGSPISLERFKDDKRRAFYGKAMLIVQSDGSGGDITVTASSPGLESSTATISAK